MNTRQQDVRYDAVVRRDASFEGLFFYAVKTTGVFCRPGCKSRTPLLRNLEFFADAQSAAAARYRPCKRCAPDRAKAVMDERLIALCRAIEQAGRLPDLRDLAAIARRSHLGEFDTTKVLYQLLTSGFIEIK
ncbi:MAG: Ada metal-binding domain-containing protein, partial [Candidatus Baltobacteraceae bacterium]